MVQNVCAAGSLPRTGPEVSTLLRLGFAQLMMSKGRITVDVSGRCNVQMSKCDELLLDAEGKSEGRQSCPRV